MFPERALLLLRSFTSRPLPISCSPTSLSFFDASRAFHSAPKPFSPLRFAEDFAVLAGNLAKEPRDARAAAAMDAMLSQIHLLDSSAAVLVLRGLAQCRKLTRAKAVLSELRRRGAVPEPFLYSLVLQCLVPGGPIRDVESVWNEVAGGGSNRVMDASAFVIYLCRRGQNAVEIERVYDRVSSSNWGLSRQAYVALIGAICGGENPNPGLARNVLREMEEKGFEADDLTYFALFRSFCRIGDVSEADSLLRSFARRWDYELDISIYGHFLHGLCKSGKFREARKLFDKLVKNDRSVKANLVAALKPGRRVIFQLTPSKDITDTMAFGAYFRSICSAGRVEEAEKMLKEAMKDTVPETCLFKSCVEALFQAGRAGDAIEFFQAERRRRQANFGGIAVPMIMGLCKMGRVDEAYRLLREMVDGGFVPTAQVWNRVLESYWEDGRVEDAMSCFEGIRTGSCGGFARPDAATFSITINGLLGKGDLERAIHLLEEMARKNIPANVNLHSAVARSLYVHGELEKSHNYVNKMIENGILVSYAGWELLFGSMTDGKREDVSLRI